MPSGSPAEGPYRSSLTPWIRSVTEASVSTDHQMVVFVTPSQIGKTDGVHVNVIGHRLATDPATVIYYGPTQTNVKKISRSRFTPMIHGIPVLYDALKKGRSDGIYEKTINGQQLIMSWAGSKAETRSISSPLVCIDERDVMPQIGPEGDIVDVAKARTFAYDQKMVIVTSSPLRGKTRAQMLDTGLEHWVVDSEEEIQSPIWRLWQGGTRGEWAWPCPHCETFFIPRKKWLRWDTETKDPDIAAESARMLCPNCGAEIRSDSVASMNAAADFVRPGEFIDFNGIHGKLPPKRVYSAWLSGLCSNWVTWEERVHDLIKAREEEQREPGALQAVVNTAFGECYAEDIPELEQEMVLRCRGGYITGDEPPGEIKTIDAGIDVQANRFVWVVRAFGAGYTSWLLAWGETWGDTSKPEVFDELQDEVVNGQFCGQLPDLVAIDAGYRPDMIYRFAQQNRGIVWPVMGQDNQKSIWRTRPVDVNLMGKTIKGSVKLGTFNSNLTKMWVHNHMGWASGTPGAWYVPDDIDEEYCDQLTAEYPTVKPDGSTVFVQTRKNNHFLDAEAMAYIMAYVSRLRRRRRFVSPHMADQKQQQNQNIGYRSNPGAIQPGSDWGR